MDDYCAKERYDNKKTAKKAIPYMKWKHGGKYRAYRCKICSLDFESETWHLRTEGGDKRKHQAQHAKNRHNKHRRSQTGKPMKRR